MSTTGWVVLGVVVLVVLWIIGVYNSLVSRRNRTQEAWSDIDVQLKRRYDLIPNLVAAVKGYAKHESDTFDKVTKARAAAMGAQTLDDKAKSENMLTAALKSVFAVAESYPELKASQNFLQLQDELSDTENKLEAGRRFYNGNVRDYNTALQTFPTSILAGAFHFTAREFFGLESEAERKAPSVSF